MHDQGISHRDLKPENILLCSKENKETLIKVTDFGLSKFFDATTVLKTFCGTPNYLAPEVLTSKGEGSYTNKVDNWSLGVILYICLAGYHPFNEDGKVPLETQIRKGSYTFPPDYWSSVSKDAIDLVKNLLNVDPDKRFTLDQVLNHKWIKNDKNLKKLAEKIMTGNKVETSSVTKDEKPNLKRNLNDKTDSDLFSDDFFDDDSNSTKRLKTSNSDSTEKSSEFP